MRIYRVFSIKDSFLKNCPPEKCAEIAPFFQVQNLFNHIEVNNIYLHSNHINSILLDENTLSKIKLNLKIKYNIVPDQDKLLSESIPFDTKKINKYSVSNTDDILITIKEHMQQDHIKKLIRLKREHQRESIIKKELIRSKVHSDFDPLFLNKKIVSIDFEYYNLNVYEVGVSTYDNGVQTNNHYLINENYINKKTKPDRQFMFKFGETDIIPEIMISSIISEHLKNVDYILAHGYSNDYLILKKYGLDLEKEERLKILDTALYYKKHFQPEQGNAFNLKTMLNMFNIDSESLHNAGNDAAYTLSLMMDMHKNIKNKKTYKVKNN